MKKLMIAAAAAAMIGGASAIESANIVGYQSVDLVAGYNLYSPTFLGVSKTLNIQDLKLDGAEGWGEDIIYILNEDGNSTGDTYTWITAENSGMEEDGWFDANGWATDPLLSGQGLYMQVGVDCVMKLPAVIEKK